ncbi:hypothetical protein RhiJN_24440 [Ceratobasidium sp. AG-Ba]|nr:hypothetical protein RhiJN_24440 [Ceratobasidium sp. AG-Ba]
MSFTNRPEYVPKGTLRNTCNRYAPLHDSYAGAVRRPPTKVRGQPYIRKDTHQWSAIQCYTVEEAQMYAERILPGANLQYIPKRERNDQNWVGPNEYLDPKRGLLTWCHEGAPRTRNAIMRTRMYVIDRLVGSTVDAVAKAAREKRRNASPKAAKEAEVGEWAVEARAHALLEEWKKLPSAPYPGLLEATTVDKMYVLVREKEANATDFKRWLGVRPPEIWRQMSLSRSMENLIIKDKNTEDIETTKADIDEGSKFDFEEWENQDMEGKLEEAMTEEMIPPLTQIEVAVTTEEEVYSDA